MVASSSFSSPAFLIPLQSMLSTNQQTMKENRYSLIAKNVKMDIRQRYWLLQELTLIGHAQREEDDNDHTLSFE